MKFKNLLGLLCVLYTLSSCNGTTDSANEGYVIQVKIENAADSLGISLYHTVDGEDITLNTSTLVNGEAVLEGIMDGLPEVYKVKVDGQDREISLFLENSKINVYAHIDSLRDAEVSGSVLNDKYDEFVESQNVIREEMKPLFPAYREAENNHDQDKMNEIDSAYNVLDKKLSAISLDFIANNTNNILGPYQASRVYYFDDYLTELDSVLKLISPSLDESVYLIKLKDRVAKWEKLKIGMEAPIFSQADSSGNIVSLEDFRGKYVLVDFWASWCGPCRAENPNIVAAYKKYHDQGFEILGVSLDTQKDRWLEAIAKDSLMWNQVSDLNGWHNEVSQSYGISAIPYSMLIDPEGKIIGKNLRQQALQDALAEAITP